MEIANYIGSRREEFLQLLQSIVERESPSNDSDLCEALATDLQQELERLDFGAELIAAGVQGPHILATLASKADGPSTLVLMHYDTVWPEGTIEERPFEVRGDVARGPGVLDMKGGIAQFLLAGRAIRDLELSPRGPVTALLTSDEETGSSSSRMLIEELARAHDKTLVLEPGAGDFDARVARKGVSNYTATFKGIPSHSGNAPEAGASAIAELARFVLHAEALTDLDRGVTVSAGIISGGGAVNVIPASAVVQLDVRAWTLLDAATIDESIRGYLPFDSRVGIEIDGGINRPPLELTEENKALHEEIRRRAKEIGRELGGARVGGGSDGSFTSNVGCPTVDGLGACGTGPHTVDEQIRVKDTLDRAHLLTLLLAQTA